MLLYYTCIIMIHCHFLVAEVSFPPGNFYHPIFAWGADSETDEDTIILKGEMTVDSSSIDGDCPYSTDFIWVKIKFLKE